MALTNFLNTTPVQTISGYNPAAQQPGTQMVQGSLQAMLDPNSAYIQNARQRGTEMAAQRGGINSSIAAGASERAAIEAAAPLAQQALAIEQGREDTMANDWLSTQNFNRSMQGQFQQGAFQNSLGMLNMVQRFAMEDPELYTPEVASGYSNFFSQNMNDILARYLSSGT